MPESMRICIYGAGSIGCYLGAHLSRVPDVAVTMVARGATLAALNDRGILLQGKDGDRVFPVAATGDPASLPKQDLVFITLKAHQVEEALPGIAALLGPDTAVVPPTTGIPYWYFHGLAGPHQGRQLERLDPGGRQWAALGPERAIGCTYWVGTDTTGPAAVHQGGPAGFPIGEPDGSDSPRLRRLHQAMAAAGLRAPIRANIRGEIWAKMINSLVWNPLATLTLAPLDAIARSPDVIAIARRCMEEAEAVAEALGTTLPTTSQQRIDITMSMTGHRMSMLQDLERGRQLEYGVLRDSIVAMREIAGLGTPTIDAMLALVALRAEMAGVAA
jgi:2-dehydropantoate 2-reductase